MIYKIGICYTWLLNSVKIPSLNLRHLTFLYVLIYVALLKHISSSLCTTALTPFYAGNAFSSIDCDLHFKKHI